MANPSNWKVRVFALGAVIALAATASFGAGCSDEDAGSATDCESASDYFAKQVWPRVQTKCMACHNAQGIARATQYVLKSPAEAGFIQHNLEVIRGVAMTEVDGQSRWLLKPTQSIPHEGGLVVQKDSDDYKAMLGLVVRLKAEEQCDGNQLNAFTGIELKDAQATLRSAAIILGRRLPTEEEVTRVEAGGYPALDQVLEEIMTEQAFYEFLKTAYGDIFGTDFYLNNDAAGAISDAYMNANWYETASHSVIEQYGLADLNELERFTQQGIAKEPLALVEWVARHDLPFTEILTADYMMFTPLSAQSYGAEMLEEWEDPNNPLEFKPGRLNGGGAYEFPHAGVLSSPMFLNRWPTTPTNRNRARARVTMLFFLGTNILLAGDQGVDQTKITALNPQRDAPECAVCHSQVDPMAGLFQAFDEQAVFTQEPQWYSEMWPAGYYSTPLPSGQQATGVPWLAEHVASDDRFPLGVVITLYRALTGREPLAVPGDYADPLFEAQFDGFLLQSNTFSAIAQKFVESNLNVKAVVKELVMSPYFRGINSVPLSQEQLVAMGDVGAAHLLTPEQLHYKILAVLGLPWGPYSSPNLNYRPRDLARTGNYQLYYGGLDHSDVTQRIYDPNGLMAAVAERMAVEMACRAAPTDFARPEDDRKLFKLLTLDGVQYDPLDLEPESGGLAIPAAQQGIKQTIVNLHAQVVGEKINVDDPEVERSYNLFLETWTEGKNKMTMSPPLLGTDLPYGCQVDQDPYTGETLPMERQVVTDAKYTIRAWMAVLTYLLSDFRFLYE